MLRARRTTARGRHTIRCRAADDGTLVMQMISGSDAARTVSVEGNTMEIRGGAKTMRLSAVIAR